MHDYKALLSYYEYVNVMNVPVCVCVWARINEFLVLTVCNDCDKNWKTNGRETTFIGATVYIAYYITVKLIKITLYTYHKQTGL